ncbi:MAG: hypothetical protein K8U57_03425 [Planctomycetes bacterium]|nr:hypothetical protein [Planctomycetota bacterium]
MTTARPLLRLTGYRSAEEVEAVFGSFLVDVAGVVEMSPDAVLVAADDPAWPKDSEDYDWLCSVISEVLTANGIGGVEMKFVPPQKT